MRKFTDKSKTTYMQVSPAKFGDYEFVVSIFKGKTRIFITKWKAHQRAEMETYISECKQFFGLYELGVTRMETQRRQGQLELTI